MFVPRLFSSSHVLASARHSVRCAYMALLLLSACVSMSSLYAAELALVTDKKVNCVIVAAKDISVSEKNAVKELQKAFTFMAGVSVPVVHVAACADLDAQTVRIVIGNATVKKMHPEVSLDGLGTDGFIIKTVGNELLMAGGEVRGTLYSVFELLEHFGWRWWAPGAIDVPKMDTITVADMDERQVPVLEYRDMLYGNSRNTRSVSTGEADTRGRWMTHNRINGYNYNTNPPQWGGRIHFDKNLVHSYKILMKPIGELDSNFKKYPEMWASVNGKRRASQPCLTNEKVFEIMTANVLKQFREHPEYGFVVVGQEDNNAYCTCENCSAITKAEGSASGPVIALANKIGAAIEEEFPTKMILTPAYTWSRTPPLHLKPRKNIGITLCSIECDFSRPIADGSTVENKAFRDDIIKWGAMTSKMYIWDYHTNFSHYFMPFPNLDVLVPNVQFFVKHGVKGILNEASRTTVGADFARLRAWMLGKAMWNPEGCDGQALITEFLEGYYGAAAQDIQNYIDVIHGPGRADAAIQARCIERLNVAYMTADVIANAEVVLRKAEASVATDPVLLKRVQLVHAPIYYMLLKRGMHSKAWSATEEKVGTLDFSVIAQDLTRIFKENGVTQTSLNIPASYFTKWANGYGHNAKDGVPLPPELKGVDPTSYCLIQAGQMDAVMKWLVPDPAASDGWAMKVLTVGWRDFYYPSTEDLEVGKTYIVHARVRSVEPAKLPKHAFVYGYWYEKRGGNKKIAGSTLKDGKYHVISDLKFTYKGTGGMLWFALRSAKPNVHLDCFWFEEVAEDAAKK